MEVAHDATRCGEIESGDLSDCIESFEQYSEQKYIEIHNHDAFDWFKFESGLVV